MRYIQTNYRYRNCGNAALQASVCGVLEIKTKNMTEELLKMKVREVKEFPYDKYGSLRTTVNTLKRNKKGEWQTCMGGFKGERILTCRRTK